MASALGLTTSKRNTYARPLAKAYRGTRPNFITCNYLVPAGRVTMKSTFDVGYVKGLTEFAMSG